MLALQFRPPSRESAYRTFRHADVCPDELLHGGRPAEYCGSLRESYQIALIRPEEAARNGLNWCPTALGESSAGLLQLAPPSVERTVSICPCPDGCAAWNAITMVAWALSAAR